MYFKKIEKIVLTIQFKKKSFIVLKKINQSKI